MSLPTHHARKSYSPLTLVKSTVVQYSPRRKVAIPCAALGAILLLFLHLYYITTYPAQLIPPKEYYSTLLSGSHAFPKHMHAQLTAALTPLPAPSPLLDGTEVYKGSWNGSGVIPNRVFQTDVRPPIESDSRTWDKNGFERIFLDDDGALAWVIDHFGESEISRTYASLPKPILYVSLFCIFFFSFEESERHRSDSPRTHRAPIMHALTLSVLLHAGRPTCFGTSFY